MKAALIISKNSAKVLNFVRVKVANKHLPGISSAKEIATNNSYDLGEMVEKLLIKVEELTLYTIEQEEKIRELEGFS